MADDAPVRYDTPEDEVFIRWQWQDAKLGRMTCECGHQMPLRFAYRCYFCHAYFCSDCAPVHFGKTRAEWQAKKDTANTGAQDDEAGH